MADTDFYLKIDLAKREVSKDSNSQRYILTIENGKVEYKYSYGGFPDPQKDQKHGEISEEKLKEIIKYIKENKINRSITEVLSEEANGPSIKVNLSLELKFAGKIFKTKISGNYRIFRADGVIKGDIIQNKDYVKNVELLIGDLKYSISMK